MEAQVTEQAEETGSVLLYVPTNRSVGLREGSVYRCRFRADVEVDKGDLPGGGRAVERRELLSISSSAHEVYIKITGFSGPLDELFYAELGHWGKSDGFFSPYGISVAFHPAAIDWIIEAGTAD